MPNETYWSYSSLGERKHPVKNLDWLHRHASEVYAITYFESSGVMLAHLHGRYYRTVWNNTSIFERWYARHCADLPLFRHA